MRTLVKKPIIILWIILVLVALFFLATKGLQFGVDFSGGTAFQIVLEHPVTSTQMAQTTSVIGRRLDWSGSKDATVTSSGDQYVIATLAESNQKNIAELKSVLLKQGNFEAVMDGNVLFSGNEIKSIYKDPTKGYGIRVVDKSTGAYQWTLPFLLSPTAANRFAEMVFHKCTPTGFGASDSSNNYDCANTYFFIDRPKESIIVMDKPLYLSEKKVYTNPGVSNTTIPIEDVFKQLTVPHFVVDENLSSAQITQMNKDFNSYAKAIVSPDVSKSVVNKLESIGYKVIVKPKAEDESWIWNASGLKSIIAITPGIANMDVPSVDSSRFQVFSNLTISGQANSEKLASSRLNDILLILESGSLPIPIESISTESISPFLGKDFLYNSLWIALFALLTVALVLFIRYKKLALTLPILLTGATEITLLIGTISAMGIRMDLAAVAGVIATIGTGVDDNIIIIDELLRGKKSEEVEHVASLLKKIKKAFFIMFASAATSAATMLPIIFFSLGLGKLVGFAITIIIGTTIGVFITRPVYAQIAKRIMQTHKFK